MSSRKENENNGILLLAIDSTYLHQSKIKTFFIALSFIVFFLNASLVYCQNDLTIFDDFVGNIWTGHFQNSEDSLLVHTIKWEYDLDDSVVIETKSVPEVNFYCKTYYFWDYETNQISYISLINKKMMSRGKAIFENGKLTLNGKTFFSEGVQENKKTYEMTEEGKLKDYFYRKSKSKWIEGHFIIYVEQ